MEADSDRQIERIAELEAALRALTQKEARYELAEKATHDAIWDWDFSTGQVRWNEALTTAYGHAPEAVDSTGSWWLAQIHPDDRTRIDASIHGVIDGDGLVWTDEYRFLRADGSYALVFDRGRVIRLFFQPVLIAWALWATDAVGARRAGGLPGRNSAPAARR